ncbi:MAG: glycogen synthase GlgA [Bryobacteraceae bacterium]
MARILMVASEAAPFVKTGGLADVIGSLPVALQARGEEVAVVIPAYRAVAGFDDFPIAFRDLPVHLAGRVYSVDIRETEHRGVPFFFVDCPPLFDRDGLYGDADGDFPDNHIRFAVFCRATLGVVRQLFRPNVLHCHDWQAALVAPYVRDTYRGDPTFAGIKLLFTIHNLGYQGIFPATLLPEMGLDPKVFRPDQMEFFGRINLLKGGIYFSDAVSTVSRKYAQEIQTPEYGFGLEYFLRTQGSKLRGILNGVDYSEWSPERDPYIAHHYSAADLSGKRDCKRVLLAEFGLPMENLDRPLIGIVSRFVDQKGFDLIADIADELPSEDVALVALGSGEPSFESLFLDLAAAHPDRFGARIGYDNSLAHRIEAGSDIFLMPSRYEPCGLNQIYSLRYGTVPVVRATGGLDDTIEEGTGFKFWEYTGPALLTAIRAALDAYHDPGKWLTMVRQGMSKDFSWDASAAEYSALYRSLLTA